MKRCNHCGQEKATRLFVKARAYADGHANICKACQSHYSRLNRYGLTRAQYEEMLESQGFGCAICGRQETSKYGHLVVDHDHATGRVRGLLCVMCNRGLGCFQDQASALAAATYYIQRSNLTKISGGAA